jgi:hypothetical protein
MRTFDAAVLVRDTAVVAGRFHAVVRAQRIVSAGQVLARVVVKIAERRRQAIAAMLARYAAERPQRVLQAFGQRDVALAAQDDMDVLKARARQPEVVQPMVKFDAGDPYRKVTHLGKIRQSHAPRFLHLAEDHIAVFSVQRTPLPDPPLHRTTHALRQLRMPPLHLLEDRDGSQARRRLEHRHDLGSQKWRSADRVGADRGRRSLRGQSRVVLDAVRGLQADRRLGGRRRLLLRSIWISCTASSGDR